LLNTHKPKNFIPALKYHAFTRFYDTVVHFTTRETVFKTALVKQSVSHPGERLLDLGCGTGTLTMMMAENAPELQVVGVDVDPATLEKAQKKLSSYSDRVSLQQGLAQQLPFKSDSFEIVVSSLFFHHLTTEQKLETLKEAFRVLKPGGRLHIADWGKPSSFVQRVLFIVVQLLDGFETTQDSVENTLPKLIKDSGFTHIANKQFFPTPLGTIRLFQATRP